MNHADIDLAVKAYEQCNRNYAAAAKMLGIPPNTLKGRILISKRSGSTKGAQPNAIPDSVSVTGNEAVVTKTTDAPVRTLADLIRVCQIDTKEWTVERWVANKWEVGAKEGQDIVVKPLFQVKAWLIRKVEVISAREEIDSLLVEAKRKVPARPRIVRGKGKVDPVMLELSIPDLHMGKLGWSPETNNADYDIRVAEDLFDEAVERLLLRTACYQPAKILLPLGNDLLHSDTKQGTTTQGTALDTDSRYHKTFGVARRMVTRAIDRLREIAPTTVIMVPGNHDTLSTFHLGDSLECYYHRTGDVTILNSPSSRKYVEFGAVALMFCHGDKGKAADWPLLFATEQPDMFGRTKFREIHTGHLHTTRLHERMGVRVRISPALCGPDAWHADNMFVGNLRGAEAYVWHKHEGLISTAHFTVSEDRNAAALSKVELGHG